MSSYDPRLPVRLICAAFAVVSTLSIGLFIHRLAGNDAPVDQMAATAHVVMAKAPSKR